MYNCMLQRCRIQQPLGCESFRVQKPTILKRIQCTQASSSFHQHTDTSDEGTPVPQVLRRSLLLQTASIVTLPLIRTQAAFANPLEDVARQVTRPSDITPLDATVALLDARSTLRCVIGQRLSLASGTVGYSFQLQTSSPA